MWYEILPCVGIMTVLLALPQPFSYFNHLFMYNGHPYRRALGTEMERRQFLRDERLNGSAYVISGLEAVPDE